MPPLLESPKAPEAFCTGRLCQVGSTTCGACVCSAKTLDHIAQAKCSKQSASASLHESVAIGSKPGLSAVFVVLCCADVGPSLHNGS